MKVKIGPHPLFFGPYQLAEKLCFWAKKEKDEYGMRSNPKWVHKFGEFLAYGETRKERKVGQLYSLFPKDKKITWLYSFLIWIDSFKKRKVQVHIDPWDTYNMDVTLAYIILPMLKEMKETKSGVPFVEDEDVPENIRSTSAKPPENKYDNDEFFEARWDWVLGEMIFAFENTIDSKEFDFISGKSDLRIRPLENGLSELVQGENHNMVIDTKGMEEYRNRISNGFLLFGKYYQSLWR